MEITEEQKVSTTETLEKQQLCTNSEEVEEAAAVRNMQRQPHGVPSMIHQVLSRSGDAGNVDFSLLERLEQERSRSGDGQVQGRPMRWAFASLHLSMRRTGIVRVAI